MVRSAIAFILISVYSTAAFTDPLHEAARDGDVDQVRARVDCRSDLDAPIC